MTSKIGALVKRIVYDIKNPSNKGPFEMSDRKLLFQKLKTETVISNRAQKARSESIDHQYRQNVERRNTIWNIRHRETNTPFAPSGK